MSDVTRILSQIDSGDAAAAEQLLPLVYDELRKLAAAKLAHEKPGQTLQATAYWSIRRICARWVPRARQSLHQVAARQLGHTIIAGTPLLRRQKP
jgi:hypothetical protein